ncbi:MAG TPA: hypothetical protein ENL12_05485 [Dehalococcoidia bacterium]|nr:hypothetical protein [Dehalococcoidia bacterium]
MSEKRMLVVDADLVAKIDENRGELSRSEFIDLLIEGQLRNREDNGRKKSRSADDDVVTREEFIQFQEGAKELLRSFLEFFINYGLELGRDPRDEEFEQLSRKLRSLARSHRE